jgi:hypothetical protein
MSKTKKIGKEKRSMPESPQIPDKFTTLEFWKW